MTTLEPQPNAKFWEALGAYMRERIVEQVISYRVYFYNLGWYSQDTGSSLEEALEIGKRAGFDFRVECNGEMMASWSVIGGTRYLKRETACNG